MSKSGILVDSIEGLGLSASKATGAGGGSVCGGSPFEEASPFGATFLSQLGKSDELVAGANDPISKAFNQSGTSAGSAIALCGEVLADNSSGWDTAGCSSSEGEDVSKEDRRD